MTGISIKRLKTLGRRTRNSLLAVLFVGTQIVFPFAASGVFNSVVSAAPLCVVDTAGANDEPGQKDLTKLCVDYAGVPTTVVTTWNWDETGTSGNNTMDACSLFDTDGDGNINYAVCVTSNNDPATFTARTTYSCGDDKIDRCTSPATVISSGSTTCGVSQVNTDPFPAGSASPKDTQGTCTVQLSTVGGASARLVDVCSYPSEQPNSDPSDCVIARNDFGKVELVKDIVPNSDTGLFNLTINGPDANDTTTVNNVGDGGTTGEVVVKKGSVVVSETAGNGTSLSSYTTAIVCKDLNGTGNSLATSSVNLTDPTTRQATFTLVEDADVVCTVTNTRQTGSITLIKNVINNNGGTATANDFGLSIGGTGVTSGQTLNLSTGSYAINEAGLTGYAFVSITGTGCPANLGGSVNLAADQQITCTITNDDIAPTLTLVKNVTNDNGGTATAANFQGKIDGTNVAWSVAVPVNAGSHTASEVALAGGEGYTPSAWGSDCAANGTVTLAVGENKTCTITNDDVAPTLTLIKHVLNDSGGTALASAWTLTATPTNGSVISGNGAASGPAQANVVYTLAESGGPSGYTASTWSCNGGSLNGNQLTLSVASNVTCDITNDDIAPLLTVTKIVVNDNGGNLLVSEVPLFVGAVQVTSGTQNSFSAGNYTVSETNPTGYQASSWSGDCATNGNITLVVGGVYACTITDNDLPAKITVTKVVINDNGGTAQVSDFALSVNATAVVSGVENTFNSNQSYTVSETGVFGYTQTSIVCKFKNTETVVPNPFTPTEGQEIVCTITNDDIAPTLTLVKNVVNNNGGTATTANFQGKVSGTNVTWGTANVLVAGSYTASETVLAGGEGYAASTWSGDCAANGAVTLTVGQNKTCTITNDDIAPTLTLVKNLPNDNGGTAVAGDFDVFISGNETTWGQHTINAGSYTVSESTLPGYTPSSWSGDCAANGAVTLAVGQNKTCAITNDDQPGSISGHKCEVDADATSCSENQGLAGWTIYLDLNDNDAFDSLTEPSATTAEDGSYTISNLNPGTYTVREVNLSDWTQIFPGDPNDEFTIVLAQGQNSTNNDFGNFQNATISGFKFEDVENNGQFDEETDNTLSGWTIFIDDNDNGTLDLGETSTTTDVDGNYSFTNLAPGTYSVCEVQQEGWVQTYPATENQCYTIGVSISGNNYSGNLFGNTELVTVNVTKYHDLDQSGTFDTQQNTLGVPEPGLSGWEILLNEASQTTGEGGTTSFTGVLPGQYSLDEVLQADWTQGAITCDTENSGEQEGTFFLTARSGETINCTIGNIKDTVLNLTKSNNRPAPTTVGDTVTYTLVVSVPADGGTSFNTLVTDLPPEGFNYEEGSWTATSSVRGDIKAGGVTTEPTYGSPGDWIVGTLIPGEIVTLTYRTLIESSVTGGQYPDIAFARGFTSLDEEVAVETLSNLSAADTPFVTTAVTVREGEVLGASVTRLVETGDPRVLIGTLISIGLIGATLATTRVRWAEKGGRA